MTAKNNNHPELIEKLTEGISNLTSSEEWQHYLDFQSRFYRYSFGNVLLIAAQCQEATQVAGFNTWRKLNRFVRKGEKAIWILAPMVYKNADVEDGQDERFIRGFKFVPVFDLAQTDGEGMPSIWALTSRLLSIGVIGAVGSGSPRGFEDEPRDVAEDAVVGNKRDGEPYRGRGDPPVSIMLALMEWVPDPFAVDP